MRLRKLPFGMQDLPANLDWLGIDEDKSDHTRLAAAIDPVMDRAALHEHVAGFQMNNGVVELHIDLARNDDGVIDRIGPVIRGETPGANSTTRKTVPFFNVVPTLRSPSSASPVLSTGKDSVVQTTQADRPGRPECEFLDNLVDLDDRASVLHHGR